MNNGFSKLAGLYWYCNEFYNGMGSWQYSVLSTSKYKPSRLARSVYEECDLEALDYYHKLIAKFEKTKEYAIWWTDGKSSEITELRQFISLEAANDYADSIPIDSDDEDEEYWAEEIKV